MRRVGLIDEVPQETPAAFVCPNCGKEYKSESALNKHIEKEHPVESRDEDA